VPGRSAGLLLYDVDGDGTVRVLLVHPGGPYWARRDAGAWSIPKGELEEGEDPLAVAVREVTEELGVAPPPGDDVPLGEVRQAGGKRVVAWARRGRVDVSRVGSNTFELEWPPRSGRIATFPEVDRAGWFRLDEAGEKLLAGQLPLLERLVALLASSTGDPPI
jgi:predicted NUDIX family NTP pyrophosphohydrolase